MGTFDKLVQSITETIKMNDKIVSLSDRIKDLSSEVRDVNNRLIRLETFVEIAQTKRLK